MNGKLARSHVAFPFLRYVTVLLKLAVCFRSIKQTMTTENTKNTNNTPHLNITGSTGALYHEMAKQGLFFFRWRSYLPLLLAVLSFPAFCHYQPLCENHILNLCWELFALFVGLFGLVIRSLVVGYAPARTSGRNVREHIADSLNITGMYSLTRNPLYLGNFFVWLAPLLLLHNIFVIIVYGKLPRRCIQLPTYTGGTTTPDLIYAKYGKDSGIIEEYFVIETKSDDLRLSGR
jgi:hypothetical protein